MTAVGSVGLGRLTRTWLNARDKCICRAFVVVLISAAGWIIASTFCRNASDAFDNRVILSSSTPQGKFVTEATAVNQYYR